MMNSDLLAYNISGLADGSAGTRIGYVKNVASNVISVNFWSPNQLPNGTADLLAFLDEFDASPEIAAELPAARRDIGAALELERGLSIRALRLRKGLSQGELARLIGTSQAAISAIENRARHPGEENIRDLARVLEVDFNTLMEALLNG